MDDNTFCILNDGTPTYCSYSYNTIDALDLAFTSSDIFTCGKWSVLDSTGSGHLPVLIELKHFHKTSNSNKAFFNFKKANREAYKQ